MMRHRVEADLISLLIDLNYKQKGYRVHYNFLNRRVIYESSTLPQ